MKRWILVWVALSAVGSSGFREYGCGSDSMTSDDYQVANLPEPDGRIALYEGFRIRDKLGRGEDVDSLSNVSTFLRVRAPAALLQEVRESPGPLHRKIFSLEVPLPAVDITLHMPDHRSDAVMDDERGCRRVVRAENIPLVPGSPSLSGHLALYARPDGLVGPRAGFEWYGYGLGLSYNQGLICTPTVEPDCPPLMGARIKDASPATVAGADAGSP